LRTRFSAQGKDGPCKTLGGALQNKFEPTEGVVDSIVVYHRYNASDTLYGNYIFVFISLFKTSHLNSRPHVLEVLISSVVLDKRCYFQNNRYALGRCSKEKRRIQGPP
jgi:hypothetical protein